MMFVLSLNLMMIVDDGDDDVSIRRLGFVYLLREAGCHVAVRRAPMVPCGKPCD